MFDIGFSELLLVMVVALVVIGPDKLPGLARTACRWVGKTQAMLRSVKAEIDRELASEDLEKSLTGNAADMATPDLFTDVKQVAEEAGHPLRREATAPTPAPATTPPPPEIKA